MLWSSPKELLHRAWSQQATVSSKSKTSISSQDSQLVSRPSSKRSFTLKTSLLAALQVQSRPISMVSCTVMSLAEQDMTALTLQLLKPATSKDVSLPPAAVQSSHPDLPPSGRPTIRFQRPDCQTLTMSPSQADIPVVSLSKTHSKSQGHALSKASTWPLKSTIVVRSPFLIILARTMLSAMSPLLWAAQNLSWLMARLQTLSPFGTTKPKRLISKPTAKTTCAPSKSSWEIAMPLNAYSSSTFISKYWLTLTHLLYPIFRPHSQWMSATFWLTEFLN